MRAAHNSKKKLYTCKTCSCLPVSRYIVALHRFPGKAAIHFLIACEGGPWHFHICIVLLNRNLWCIQSNVRSIYTDVACNYDNMLSSVIIETCGGSGNLSTDEDRDDDCEVFWIFIWAYIVAFLIYAKHRYLRPAVKMDWLERDITKCKTHSPLINVQSLINEAMRYKEYSNHCTFKVPPALCL